MLVYALFAVRMLSYGDKKGILNSATFILFGLLPPVGLLWVMITSNRRAPNEGNKPHIVAVLIVLFSWVALVAALRAGSH